MTEWQASLDDRQRKEIALARLYARDFAHGTVGHNQLMLIDQLATLLDAAGSGQPFPEPVLTSTVLDVPYHSQHEADAEWFRKDCGPACLEMAGEFLQPTAGAVTTNEIMQFITKGVDRSTYIHELQRAFEHFYGRALDRHDGATWEQITGWIGASRPAIVLVHYGSFGMRMDRGYTVGHYMVAIGYDEIHYQGETIKRAICHDPDWYGALMAQGAFIPVVKEHFMTMWEDCFKDNNPRRLALVPRVG